VIETSGVPALLNQAVQMVRPGGTVRLVALYDEPVSLDVNAIVQKELDFRGSFGYRGEFPEAIELIRSGRVRVAPLVTHTFPLERIGEAFEAQMSKDESVKVVVQP
jgi:threonine dehydrogenase-like Zn-dependent dehydrogenase